MTPKYIYFCYKFYNLGNKHYKFLTLNSFYKNKFEKIYYNIIRFSTFFGKNYINLLNNNKLILLIYLILTYHHNNSNHLNIILSTYFFSNHKFNKFPAHFSFSSSNLLFLYFIYNISLLYKSKLYSVNIPCKTSKITVLKSPQGHKKAREQFSLKSYKKNFYSNVKTNSFFHFYTKSMNKQFSLANFIEYKLY